MNLLITGGCGFLGSNLAAHAMTAGHEVTLFDNLSRDGSRINLSWLQGQGRFRFIHGDIRSLTDVTLAVTTSCPDAVFHLAGQVAMTTSIGNPRLDFETNLVGSHNLLESVRLYVPQAAVLYSSTNKVYGDLEQFEYHETETRYECIDRPSGFDESTPLDFHSPYGCSKGAADQYMLDYARIYGLKTVVFRHSSMYGGRQFATSDQGWVGWFCRQAVETVRDPMREAFTISGNGKQVRDLLHADDMIRLYFSALEHIEDAKGHVFNIGGGMVNSLSLLELFTLLEDVTGARLRYNRLPKRESDQRVFVADIKRARDLFAWSPGISVHEGIKRMIEWSQ
jgi:CDP-paratose 2-epimerase